MRKSSTWLVGVLAMLALVACGQQKGPAEQALSSAQSALSAIHDQAQKYVPDQLQAVQAQLDGMKSSLASGDYKAVLAAAPALTSAIAALKTAAAAKQSEVEAALAQAKDAWGSASTDLPKMVDAIAHRVDVLSKSHHLPKGITAETLANAKSGLQSMRAALSAAGSAASSGDYTGAMNQAKAVQAQAKQIMQSLQMGSS